MTRQQEVTISKTSKSTTPLPAPIPVFLCPPSTLHTTHYIPVAIRAGIYISAKLYPVLYADNQHNPYATAVATIINTVASQPFINPSLLQPLRGAT